MFAELMEFLIETYGIQFIMQYMGGKVLDKLPNKIASANDDKTLWQRFYAKIWELLCDKNKWENDFSKINDALCEEDYSLDLLYDEEKIDELLSRILGDDYKNFYCEDILSQWYECSRKVLMMDEFSAAFVQFAIDKLQQTDKFNEYITSEFPKIKEKLKHLEDEWNQRDREFAAKKIDEELNGAIEDIEDNEFESAIEKLKRYNCQIKDPEKKFSSYCKMGYCYKCMNDFERSLKWYLKAEKFSSADSSAMIMLVRNIALLYIYLGQNENKCENYEKSNEYLQKMLNMVEKGSYSYYEALIHLARNKIDVCDEVAIEDARNYMNDAVMLIAGVCSTAKELPEDIYFVLLQNIGRLFFQMAEKIDERYICDAHDFYQKVLELKHVKNHKDLLAMSLINLGLSYQRMPDTDNKFENQKSAIACFMNGIKTYKALGEKTYSNELANAKLDLASAYKSLYMITGEIEYLKNSISETEEIISAISYDPNNSLLYRVYLMQLNTCVLAQKNGINPSEYIDLDSILTNLEIMTKQYDFEKYKYTYQILMCELELAPLYDSEDNSAKLNEIKERLTQIKESVKDNNNMSAVIEDILLDFDE